MIHRYPRLHIEHNHGHLHLANAQWDDERNVVVGTVLSGGSTSRLFWATSHTPFPVGEQMSWNLWRAPHAVPSMGYSAEQRWLETPTPGLFRASTVSCG